MRAGVPGLGLETQRRYAASRYSLPQHDDRVSAPTGSSAAGAVRDSKESNDGNYRQVPQCPDRGRGGNAHRAGETVDEKDERVDLGHDAQILVAVIHVGHLTNRADLKVEEPVNNPWVAKTGSQHFNENDEVYAVGAATQKAADRPRLFADGFTVSLK